MAAKTTDLSKQKNAVVFNDSDEDHTTIGSNYNDTLDGKGGNDILAGGNGNDIIHGGAGNDQIWGDSLGNASLANDNGQDFLFGDEGSDELHGGNAKDVVDGGSGNDVLFGDNGSDALTGGLGDDVLVGGNGPDRFTYNVVLDSEYHQGGPGTVTTAWTAAGGSAWGNTAANPWDVITDFVSGEDKLDLSPLPLTGGNNLVSDLIWRGAQGSDADANTARPNFDHSVWTDDGGNFVYADTDGDGKADVKIQVHGVGAGDFIGVENNDAPVFTSGTTGSVPENSPITTVAYDAAATDQEGDDITFSLVSGGDNDLFHIDPLTGVVTFIASPNYESPQDAGGDNNYDVTVVASDGFVTTNQAVSISVTDVNEQPNAGDDFAASTPENILDTQVIATVVATDPDTLADTDSDLTNDTFNDLSYSITAGNGLGLFEIDANGNISLASGQFLDFETQPHQHVLTVTVTDGGSLSDTVDVTINVTNDPNDDGQFPADSVGFALLQNGNELAHLGHFFADVGSHTVFSVAASSLDPDTNPDVITVGGGVLSANGAGAGTFSLEVTATGDDGSATSTYTLWIGTNDSDSRSFALVSGNNIGIGQQADDTIVGSNGLDFLLGSSADDSLTGKGGADQLEGGGGNDTFFYLAPTNSVGTSTDTIFDFTHGKDKIDVAAIDSGNGTDGAFTWGNMAPTANGVWYNESGGNTTLHFDTNGNMSDDEMTIVLLGTGLNLDANDFHL